MPKYYNTSLRNLIHRLRKFKDILDQELKDEILRNEEVIVKMIADEQLYEQGIEGRGIKIASYKPYAPRTIRDKIRKGQPYDRVTLRDTGEFHASLKVVFDNEGFYITSDDEKSQYLLDKYGKTIFRLSDENLKILINDYIRPSLKSKLKERLKNG
jgi:hypothetical protein